MSALTPEAVAADHLEGRLFCVGCDWAPEFAASGPGVEEFAVRMFQDMGWQEYSGHWWCPTCAASPVRRVRLTRSDIHALLQADPQP